MIGRISNEGQLAAFIREIVAGDWKRLRAGAQGTYATRDAAAAPINTAFVDAADGKLKFKDATGTVNDLY